LRRKTAIGRNAAKVDICVLDDGVSMIHAELSYCSGIWTLTDSGSTNGTFVDGRRVTGTMVVQSGQVIVVGDVGFLFVEQK
jgi:pSer/pThr/pTyr-binding forkhead associated (FHA) protein